MTKRVKRKPGDPTPAQKAVATKKRKKLEAEQVKKKTDNTSSPTRSDPSSKPLIEKPDVVITPYPRTGDNKNFEDVLDNVGSADGRPVKTEPAKPAVPTPAITAELLTVEDVAEWVAWPFLLWAQSNDLERLAISAKEATSVAEPLTTILNRHGAAKHLPPDAIDALKVGARVTPILLDRFAAIKQERIRRKAVAAGASPAAAAQASVQPGAQGAAATKPKEV